MKCQVLAFHLTVKPTRLQGFLAELVGRTQPAVDKAPFYADQPHRQLHLEVGPDGFLCGLIITVRNHSAFWTALETGATIEVQPQDLADRRVAELNFFICHPRTGSGLYITYHRSCLPTGLGQLLRFEFQDWILKQFPSEKKPDLEFAIQVNDRTIETFLGEVQRVKNAQFSYIGLSAAESKFVSAAGVEPRVDRSKLRVGFSPKNGKLTGAKQAVLALFRDDKIENARVEAVDEDGLPAIFRLQNDHLTLGELDHDHMVLQVSQTDLEIGLQHTQPVQFLLSCAGTERVKTILGL